MSLKYSINRAVEITHSLPETIIDSRFLTHEEDSSYSPPMGVTPGSLEHVIFITLTLSIDNGLHSSILWDSSRQAYESEQTRYLFSPESLFSEELDQVRYDLKNLNMGGTKNKNAEIWKNAGSYLFQKWGGDPRNFLRSCQWNGPEILNRMISARYHEAYDFQHFIGERKGMLWLSLLKNDAGIDTLTNLNKIPLLTDIHIVRASIALGLAYGSYSGQISLISQKVRELWEEALTQNGSDKDGITTFDLSEVLRNLSRNGCSHKDGKRTRCQHFEECPFNRFCVEGLFALENKGVLIDTMSQSNPTK
ncbi:hypothetical protein [Methanospirillum lacunae]|uniref:Iron-sulfur cluster loop n=1 Tax=Methanospirillum lacunae TaxID=668570 RepID=A0A2V2N5Y9_9EURY|nr:hypothetical protein [Methanospirillum lacunae]PWR70931.1 hypothetical protein DK846_13160 [Methanospirillum lacunae]